MNIFSSNTSQEVKSTPEYLHGISLRIHEEIIPLVERTSQSYELNHSSHTPVAQEVAGGDYQSNTIDHAHPEIDFDQDGNSVIRNMQIMQQQAQNTLDEIFRGK